MYTTSDKMADLPIVNGQITALSDREGYFYDHEGKRFEVGGVHLLESAPVPGTPGVEGSIYVCPEPPGIYLYLNGSFQNIAKEITITSSGSGNVVTSVSKSATDSTGIEVKKDITAATKTELDNHIAEKNPHGTSKGDLGLGSVDNTPDNQKNVLSAQKLTTGRGIDGVNFDGTANIHHFVQCDTDAATADKVVTVPGFVNYPGAHLYVLFKSGNTAAVDILTLQVNEDATSKGSIVFNGSALTDPQAIKVGTILDLLFVNGKWNIAEGIDTVYPMATTEVDGLLSHTDKSKLDNMSMLAGPSDDLPQALGTAKAGSSDQYSRADHVHPLPEGITGGDGGADHLTTEVYVDGLKFDGTQNISRFAICDTAGDVAAKTVTIDDTISVDSNLVLIVQFKNTNTTGEQVTLTVNESSPYPIKLNGADPSLGFIQANGILFLVFTGTSYEIVASSKLVADSASLEESTFSEADRTKLDGIQEGATRTVPSDANPLPVGQTASPGTAEEYSRADHVHSFNETITGVTAETADRLTYPRDINLTGDVTGTGTFDGSADVDIATTLELDVFSTSTNGLVPKAPAVPETGATMFLRQDAQWVEVTTSGTTDVMTEEEYANLATQLGITFA